MSSAGAISFPSWTPPALPSLNFSSNCTVARAFLQSWFDLGHYKDVVSMPGHEYNVTFWVPTTVDATVTETYFRQALPHDLQAVASYGEILEWERLLRGNYTRAVGEFLRLADGLNGTETDSLPLDIPYYYHVIDAPSRACRDSVCSLGFDWDRLGDVNGPGVFVYYVFLWAIGCGYSLIALLGACKYRSTKECQPAPYHLDRAPPRHRSWFGDLFATVKASFSGFSDSAAVFSLALPCAIFYSYVGSGGVRDSARKDLVLELWVLVYALCVCVWFYRVGACIRRAERAKNGRPRTAKRWLATGLVLFLSVVAFALLVVFLVIYHNRPDLASPFQFEKFWDDVCGYGRLMSMWQVILAGGLLVGYCGLRVVLGLRFILGLLTPSALPRPTGHIPGPHERHHHYPTAAANGAGWMKKKAGRIRELYWAAKCNRRRQRWANNLGMLDVVVLGGGSGAILWYYYQQRNQLSASIGINGFRDGWTLGQILAVSSLLPILIGFVHTFVEVRDRQ